MESLAALKIPSILMVIFFIGIVVSTWIALDPIRQKQRKSKYFFVTLVCFIGFILVAWWDLDN
jgi:UDP-N-acetylmuramyl pentapeptide phosphotransferase/UDP-N-acetylglucosamine-1-phosphate transferase